MIRYLLVIGDLIAIAVVALIGFATHGETDISFLPRMAALYFPLCLAWFILAPGLGLFHHELTASPRQLWRPVLAALFAAPFAAVLRGFLLNAPVIPIFAAVLSLATALGMAAWRALYLLLLRRGSR